MAFYPDTPVGGERLEDFRRLAEDLSLSTMLGLGRPFSLSAQRQEEMAIILICLTSVPVELYRQVSCSSHLHKQHEPAHYPHLQFVLRADLR